MTTQFVYIRIVLFERPVKMECTPTTLIMSVLNYY